jgi:hypothetical protein
MVHCDTVGCPNYQMKVENYPGSGIMPSGWFDIALRVQDPKANERPEYPTHRYFCSWACVERHAHVAKWDRIPMNVRQ